MKIDKDFQFRISISPEGFKDKRITGAMIGSRNNPENRKIRAEYGYKPHVGIGFREEIVNPQQLYDALTVGHTFCNVFHVPASSVRKDGCFGSYVKKNDFFIQSNVISVDIDNGYPYNSVEQFIRDLSIPPTMYYTSYSNMKKGAEILKFHMIYVFDEPITDRFFYRYIALLINRIIYRDTKVQVDYCNTKCTQYFNGTNIHNREIDLIFNSGISNAIYSFEDIGAYRQGYWDFLVNYADRMSPNPEVENEISVRLNSLIKDTYTSYTIDDSDPDKRSFILMNGIWHFPDPVHTFRQTDILKRLPAEKSEQIRFRPFSQSIFDFDSFMFKNSDSSKTIEFQLQSVRRKAEKKVEPAVPSTDLLADLDKPKSENKSKSSKSKKAETKSRSSKSKSVKSNSENLNVNDQFNYESEPFNFQVLKVDYSDDLNNETINPDIKNSNNKSFPFLDSGQHQVQSCNSVLGQFLTIFNTDARCPEMLLDSAVNVPINFDIILKDWNRYGTETFRRCKEWIRALKNMKYIYRTENEWVDGLYQFVDDNYLCLYYNREVIKDGEKRKTNLFKNLCLRRIICPNITREELIFNALVDVIRFYDNKDKVLSSEFITKSVEYCLRMSINDIRSQYGKDIEYLKDKKTPKKKIIYKDKESRSIETTYLIIDKYYNKELGVNENYEIISKVLDYSLRTIYDYAKVRGYKTDPSKLTDEELYELLDITITVKDNVAILKANGKKSGRARILKMFKQKQLDYSNNTPDTVSEPYVEYGKPIESVIDEIFNMPLWMAQEKYGFYYKPEGVYLYGKLVATWEELEAVDVDDEVYSDYDYGPPVFIT